VIDFEVPVAAFAPAAAKPNSDDERVASTERNTGSVPPRRRR